MCVQWGELEGRVMEEAVDQIREFGARDLLCLEASDKGLGDAGWGGGRGIP